MKDILQDFRRSRMREEIASETYNGNAATFAKAAGKSETQINDMLSTPPRKAFGERIARDIAKNLKKPLDYFDKPIDLIECIQPAENKFAAKKKTKRDLIIEKINACLENTSDQGLDFILGAAEAAQERSPMLNKQVK